MNASRTLAASISNLPRVDRYKSLLIFPEQPPMLVLDTSVVCPATIALGGGHNQDAGLTSAVGTSARPSALVNYPVQRPLRALQRTVLLSLDQPAGPLIYAVMQATFRRSSICPDGNANRR